MSEHASLLDELEATLARGTVQRRLRILQRVTDLFIAGSRRYSGGEIAIFDDVLTQLAAEIETKTRAQLSRTMAKLSSAPPKLVRQLAFDDAITVAAPVLVSSPLSDADLVENATIKSQDHLYAIAQRPELTEAVTDVLVARGDRRVVRRAARNSGARFSLAGYWQLVKRAHGDDKLAFTIGWRSDIPHECFLKLIETASANVREKLETINPKAARAIQEAVAEVATSMQHKARDTSRAHVSAVLNARHRFRAHKLSEASVHGSARSQQFEQTVVALSLLGPLPIDLVERALIDKGTEMILILMRAAGCSWTTAKAALMMHCAGRRLSKQDMDSAFGRFERLSPATAMQLVKFYERRNNHAADTQDRPIGALPAPSNRELGIAERRRCRTVGGHRESCQSDQTLRRGD